MYLLVETPCINLGALLVDKQQYECMSEKHEENINEVVKMRKRRRKRSSMDSDDDRQDLWAPSGDNEIKVTTHTGFKEVEMRSE